MEGATERPWEGAAKGLTKGLWKGLCLQVVGIDGGRHAPVMVGKGAPITRRRLPRHQYARISTRSAGS